MAAHAIWASRLRILADSRRPRNHSPKFTAGANGMAA